MKPALPTQIPLCGRRPPAIGGLIGAMQQHQRPFVLMMQEEDRHELVATVTTMADRLGLVPFLIAADDTATQELYLLGKEKHLLVIVETPKSRIPVGTQQFILERYEPARNEHKIAKRMLGGASQREIQDSLPKAHPPAGLLIVTDTDPGDLLTQKLWTMPFTELKQYTVHWDKMPQRPDAYIGIFRAGLTLAAREAKISIDGRVDDEAVARYARMQKILANHARKAKERGMIEAHQSTAEILAAARDCVLYISHKVDRRIDTNVIEALVFKGITEAAIKTTFGLAERAVSARKSRPSFGPDAPYASGKLSAVGE